MKLLKKKAFYKKEGIARPSQARPSINNESTEKMDHLDIGNSFDVINKKNNKLSTGDSAALIEVNDVSLEMPLKHSLDYDAKSGFPETPKENIVAWQEFNKNIGSDEADAAWVLANICDEYSDEWLDLRPYMIEKPITVSVYTKFKDVIELYRMHHLRHLIVVMPHDG